MVMPDELPMLVQMLEETGIPYALTGSLASMAWGQPRATYDADVLVDLRAADIDKLIHAFPSPGWYLDRDAIVEALRGGGEFNAIHGATGTKVDFWVKTNRPADAMRFARRRRATVAGVACWVLSPEDTILAKLEWIQAAPSDRQKADVAGILAAQADKLDFDYLREWAERLGARELLDEALRGGWRTA